MQMAAISAVLSREYTEKFDAYIAQQETQFPNQAQAVTLANAVQYIEDAINSVHNSSRTTLHSGAADWPLLRLMNA